MLPNEGGTRWDGMAQNGSGLQTHWVFNRSYPSPLGMLRIAEEDFQLGSSNRDGKHGDGWWVMLERTLLSSNGRDRSRVAHP